MSGAGDTVALIVSELITNSVAASRALDGGPFPVLLRLLSDRSEILIMVHDASLGQPGRLSPADDAEGGRGLMLVEAVSKRWDWYAVPGGKVVWALCEAPG
jgi:anti-sigma regulatory factor (Ser/Thr protein kinase)